MGFARCGPVKGRPEPSAWQSWTCASSSQGLSSARSRVGSHAHSIMRFRHACVEGGASGGFGKRGSHNLHIVPLKTEPCGQQVRVRLAVGASKAQLGRPLNGRLFGGRGEKGCPRAQAPKLGRATCTTRIPAITNFPEFPLLFSKPCIVARIHGILPINRLWEEKRSAICCKALLTCSS